MRVILRIEIMGVSKGGFVKLYRACKEHNVFIKYTDPASNAFHARIHFSGLGGDTLGKIKELIKRIDQVSSYCEALVTAIIPHEDLPRSETTPEHGCPREIERHLKKICARYVRSTHEGRGVLEINGVPTLIVCRRRTTQILPIKGRADTYSLTSPPTPTRIACDDKEGLERILKQLKDAASLLRQYFTQ